MTLPLVARHALVSGGVQGVGFRYSAVRQAEHLGLNGWVKNLPDGRVEAFFEGDLDAVEQFEKWLHEGPAGARVRGVALTDREPIGERGFDIRR